jgi:F-type H+-transporting ATPase subunit delta
MNTTAHFSPAARAYAQSLIELAGDSAAVSTGQELADIHQILVENKSFRLYLVDPGISIEAREATIKSIFGGRASQLVVNFLGLLNSKNRLRLLDEVIAAYRHLLDTKLGRVQATLTVASALSPADLAEVQSRVSKALGKTATLEQKVDDGIIGGMVLRVDDKIIDASVRQQLKAMKASFLASAPQ